MDTVLFVDDEKLITNSLRRGLIDEEYEKFFANSGEEALEILEKESVSVIVTDMKMPGMTGLTLLNIVKKKYPNIVRIVLSGYTQLPQVLITVNQAEIFKFITKPWNLEEEFIIVIREAINYFNFKEEQIKLEADLKKKNILFQNILKKYDDVVKESRKEVKQAIKINRYVFDAINQMINAKDETEQGSEGILEKVQSLENIVIDILSIIPTNVKRFTMHELAEELKLNLKDIDYKTKLDITIDKSIDSSYRGKYSYILRVLKNIIINFIYNSLDHTIAMVFVGEKLEEELSYVTFILKLKKEAMIPTKDTDRVFNLMKVIIEGVNGELSMKSINGNMIIILKIELGI